MARIVVVGSVNMDLVAMTDRFPAPGETVLGFGFDRFPGGKGANQAVAAARLGAPVAFVGAVGDDAFGADLAEHLVREGIDAGALAVVPGVPTGTALIVVAHGENAIVAVPGANAAIDPAVAGATIAHGDRVCASLEVPLAVVRAAFEAARAVGAGTLLNAAPAVAEARALLPLTDILVVNETELAHLAGRPAASLAEIEAAAERLRADGAGIVVVTRGAEGVAAVGPDGTVAQSGHDVIVIDTTGAGDGFVGALAAGLWSGASLGHALERANAAAALSVQVPGAAPSMPTGTAVEAFLATVAIAPTA